MLQVPLNPGFDGPRLAFLSEPSGHDELACAEIEPWVASELLARLLVERPGSALQPVDAGRMALCDRDRLVAELYRYCFGDQIESRVRCRACEKTFDLSFTLSSLLEDVVERVREAQQGLVTAEASGVYTLSSGLRVRLPQVADEKALLAAPPDRALDLLWERCVLETTPQADEVGMAEPTSGARLEAEQALEALAPVLSMDLPVSCVECGAEQLVEFDMVRFFLGALRRERTLLVREVHCLASAYHWSHAEILGLPRSVRRAYVSLVLGEREARGFAA